jgi:hypothetical protein
MSDMPKGLVAALASRYALEREVGAGGMATVAPTSGPIREVYRAEASQISQ